MPGRVELSSWRRGLPAFGVLVSACAWIDPLEDDYRLRTPTGIGGGSGGEGATTAGGSAGTGGTTGTGGSPGGAGPGGGAIVWSFGERPTSDQQGVTYDTQLNDHEPTFNFGARPTGWTDASAQEQRVVLLRFDLGAVAPTATVEAASLRLFTADGDLSKSVGTVRLFRLLESWTEGNQNGASGVANWTERESGVGWTTVGAGEGAHDHSVELAAFIGAASSTEYAVELPAALVQDWVNDPTTNFGLVALTYSDDGTEIALREHGNATHRPELVVTFAP